MARTGAAYIPYSAFAVFYEMFEAAAASWGGNWGTGSAVISRKSTEIAEEGTENRVAVAISPERFQEDNDGFSISVTQAADAKKTITNWGVLDEMNKGEPSTLLLNATHNPIELEAAHSMTAVWQYQWA